MACRSTMTGTHGPLRLGPLPAWTRRAGIEVPHMHFFRYDAEAASLTCGTSGTRWCCSPARRAGAGLERERARLTLLVVGVEHRQPRTVVRQADQLRALGRIIAKTRAPTGSAAARAVDMSAIRFVPLPVTFSRVTGPRNVCVGASPWNEIEHPVRRGFELEGLRPDQDQHALAVLPTPRRVDLQAHPAVLDLAGAAVGLPSSRGGSSCR